MSISGSKYSKKGGLHQDLGALGVHFSGGERQRLEIAAALIQRPDILILDEATSALDPMTEALVYEHIKKQQATLIVIAHRLSTIRNCDEIIVLEQGKIVQKGAHDELIKQPGLYQQLVSTEQ